MQRCHDATADMALVLCCVCANDFMRLAQTQTLVASIVPREPPRSRPV
ncbi:MAG: hypothetical protein IJ111_05410 [Eggerthellaceae bacterium]|nr:hypothetical protein [Eggerthellaceae bacterium]